MTAVQMPAIGGQPLALAMPRHSGIAIRKTRNPACASNFRFGSSPGVSGGTVGGDGVCVSATFVFSRARGEGTHA